MQLVYINFADFWLMKQKTKFKETEIGMIHGDWEVKRLKEVTLQIFSGGTPNTRNLSKIRDSLLPKLMSGKIRVG